MRTHTFLEAAVAIENLLVDFQVGTLSRPYHFATTGLMENAVKKFSEITRNIGEFCQKQPVRFTVKKQITNSKMSYGLIKMLNLSLDVNNIFKEPVLSFAVPAKLCLKVTNTARSVAKQANIYSIREHLMLGAFQCRSITQDSYT